MRLINTYPLLRVDNKTFLEKLIQGELYMHTNLHYQKNTDDNERGDLYDGAVYGDRFSQIMPGEIQGLNIRNPRIVLGNSYIKSFFQFSDEEVEMIGENVVKYTLSERSVHTLNSFYGADSLMIIIDIDGFIKQFSEACEKKKMNYWYDNVHYLTDEEIDSIQQEYIRKNIECTLNPCFIKRIKYKNQQEFRLCVQHSFNPDVNEKIKKESVVKFDYKIVDKSYTLNIGKIDEYSTIMPIKDFIGKALYVDYKRQLFSVN